MTRYNEPVEGATGWHEPLNENFSDLGIEVTEGVSTWADLPATTEVSQSTGGQWPVYRVEADDVFVQVTDSAQNIIGGLGSSDHPLPPSHHELLNTDRADSESYTSAFALSTNPFLVNQDYSNVKSAQGTITLMAQITNFDSGATTHTTFKSGNYILQYDERGNLEDIAQNDSVANGNLEHVACDSFGNWLLITGDSAPYDAHQFDSAEDISSNTIEATISGVYPPLVSTIAPYAIDGGAPGFLFAEYTTVDSTTAPNLNIHKVDATGATSTPLTLSRPSYRHFHSLDEDPYNPGTFYASTGDSDAQVSWFKSTDYGDTWTELSVGESQDYRTLRLNFEEDYVYWAMGGVDGNGEAHFYRATRGNLSNPESLGVIGDDSKGKVVSYGSTRFWEPKGILVSVRDDDTSTSNGFTTMPIFFYNIENEIAPNAPRVRSR